MRRLLLNSIEFLALSAISNGQPTYRHATGRIEIQLSERLTDVCMDAECLCVLASLYVCVSFRAVQWTTPPRLALYQSRRATKLTLETRAVTAQLDDFTVAFSAPGRSESSIACSTRDKIARTNCRPSNLNGNVSLPSGPSVETLP
jgi:hypothetical protein